MVARSEEKMSERVPRADKLNLIRDILFLLDEMNGISGRRRLFYETKKRITKPEVDFSVESTFNDYLIAEKKLALVKVTKSVATITKNGRNLVNISKFGERVLNKSEKSFLRSLLFAYFPFRDFLSIGFCRGRKFANEGKLYEYADCPKRDVIMNAYMTAKGQNTDREARTLLGWSVQIGLTEFDEYGRRYYLVKERDIDLDSFLKELYNTYSKVRDSRTKMALIPKVRLRLCCSTNTQKSAFDNNILKLYKARPSKVQLGRGSSSRDDVLRFGVQDKTFYYYYIRIVAE